MREHNFKLPPTKSQLQTSFVWVRVLGVVILPLIGRPLFGIRLLRYLFRLRLARLLFGHRLLRHLIFRLRRGRLRLLFGLHAKSPGLDSV